MSLAALSKMAGATVIGPVTRISRASLSVGHILRAWRGSRVVPISKTGRVSFASARYFCPISLKSFILKKVEWPV